MDKLLLEMREIDIERKTSMRDLIEAYNHWRVMAKRGWFNFTEFSKNICKEALEYYWGKGSRIEFDYPQLKIKCTGMNGEFLELTGNE